MHVVTWYAHEQTLQIVKQVLTFALPAVTSEPHGHGNHRIPKERETFVEELCIVSVTLCQDDRGGKMDNKEIDQLVLSQSLYQRTLDVSRLLSLLLVVTSITFTRILTLPTIVMKEKHGC